MHCENPECVAVCPTGAACKRAVDVVFIDQEMCIGYSYRTVGCPFGVPRKSEETGTARKCTFCLSCLVVAAYTGVLLATSGQPVWADTPLLPVLFVLSGTSTGLAAIMLMLRFLAREDRVAVTTVEKGNNLIIKLELVVMAVFFVILFFFSGASRVVYNFPVGVYAVFSWVGFMGASLVLPLLIRKRVLLPTPSGGLFRRPCRFVVLLAM